MKEEVLPPDQEVVLLRAKVQNLESIVRSLSMQLSRAHGAASSEVSDVDELSDTRSFLSAELVDGSGTNASAPSAESFDISGSQCYQTDSPIAIASAIGHVAHPTEQKLEKKSVHVQTDPWLTMESPPTKQKDGAAGHQKPHSRKGMWPSEEFSLAPDYRRDRLSIESRNFNKQSTMLMGNAPVTAPLSLSQFIRIGTQAPAPKTSMTMFGDS